MKKYLVCSDIHERTRYLEEALKKHSDIDGVILAGDYETDSYDIDAIVKNNAPKGASLHMVKGNCDAYIMSTASLPNVLTFNISLSHKVYLTHGHLYHGRADMISYAAQENYCDIVIFGHIHKQVDDTLSGIRVLNPGALKNNSYLILTIDDNENIEVQFHG